MEKQGDLFITKDKIINSLDQYGYEEEDIDHLLYSACMPNRLYSFNKLSVKLRKAQQAPDFAPLEDEEEDDEDYAPV